MQTDQVAVVIPSYNEATQLRQTLASVLSVFKNVVLVDDGSTDNTEEIAKNFPIRYIKHPINLGQGAALQTGISAALEQSRYNYILTYDADGQHSIDSAIKMFNFALKTNCDIVLGSRFLSISSNMPVKKKVVLRLGIFFTRFDTGLKITDAHNGLRIMRTAFAQKLKIRQSGMAHASEILQQISELDANWQEFPVEIYYSEYSIKKGQSVFNAVNILTEMIHKW